MGYETMDLNNEQQAPLLNKINELLGASVVVEEEEIIKDIEAIMDFVEKNLENNIMDDSLLANIIEEIERRKKILENNNKLSKDVYLKIEGFYELIGTREIRK